MHVPTNPLVLACACLACVAAQAVTIEVGCFSPEYGHEWFSNEIQAFREAHPDISVEEFNVYSPGRYKNPVEQWDRFSRNVVGLDSESGNEVQFFVENGLLAPVEEFLPDPDFKFDDFYASVWPPVRYKGKTWGVPWNYWSVLLLMNWPLFEEEGITRPPETWRELQKIGRRLTKDRDGDGEIDQWGMRISMRHEGLPYAAVSKVYQDGGHLMKDGRFDVNNQTFIRAFNFFGGIICKGGFIKLDNRDLAEVAGETDTAFAMEFLPTFDLPAVQDKPNYRIAPIPTDGRQVVLAECRQYFAIRRSTPEEERASWEFVKWMTRAGVSLGPSYDVFPCRKSIASRPEVTSAAGRVQGLVEAFRLIEHTVDLEDNAFNRRQAFINMIRRLGVPVATCKDVTGYISDAEKRANAMLLPPNVSVAEIVSRMMNSENGG